jgi:tRNA A37 threonylcarbamoyladenosine synthetase subunit TsaC/SUA5/YrdC
MARYFDVHPVDPQPHSIAQVVALLREDALIAYPTDSCYALGCQMGNPTGAERIRRLRNLDDRHHFTLVCADFAQLGQLVHLDNKAFRAIKAATPGPYTFILRELGEPLVSSTLLLPDAEEPMNDGWQIQDELGQSIDAVVDSGECGKDLTTVVDWSEGYPQVVRVGMGDPALFQ